MRFRTAVLALILVLLVPFTATARQTTRPAAPASQWQISVLTFGPGPLIFERYGHCAIRLHNLTTGFDACFDWGNFSFDDPNFFGRFLLGELRYWMEGKDAQSVLTAYIGADRTVTEQILDLTPDETAKLIEIVRQQDDDDHRYYAYDYFRDNCATRIRDVIDQATNGAVRHSLSQPVSQTFRSQNRRLVPVGATNDLLAVLMDFAMGPRVDAPLTRWDDAFIPTTLSGALDVVRLNDEAGDRPLVRERRTLHATTTSMNAEPAAPAKLVAWTLPVGIVGGLLMLGLARSARHAFYFLASAWSLFCGIGGVFIIGLWAFTGHWPIAWNENLLQFSPLSFVVLVAIWHRRTRPAARRIATVIAGLSAAGALVTISHLTRQQNAPAIVLALPLHLAVWGGLRRMTAPAAPESPESADTIPLTPRMTT